MRGKRYRVFGGRIDRATERTDHTTVIRGDDRELYSFERDGGHRFYGLGSSHNRRGHLRGRGAAERRNGSVN